MRPFYLFLDELAAILGVFSNALLILAVKKRTAKNFRSYGNMVLVSALIDLTYALVILACHHQLQFVNGVMLINSYSLDPVLPLWPRFVLGSLEHFFVLEAIIILPAQYWYRYYLLTHAPQRNDYKFFTAVGVTLLLSSGMAVMCILANFAALKRGNAHYVPMLDASLIHGPPASSFVEAVDMNDWQSWLYIGWAGFVINVCYCGACYFCYKSLTSISPALSGGLSKKAASMKRQFTINLIVQTANSFLFAMLPMFIIACVMFFGVNPGKLNVLFMSVMAWAPAANGFFSIAIVRPYRQFIFRTTPSSVHATTKSTIAAVSSRPNVSTAKSTQDEFVH